MKYMHCLEIGGGDKKSYLTIMTTQEILLYVGKKLLFYEANRGVARIGGLWSSDQDWTGVQPQGSRHLMIRRIRLLMC